MKERESIPQNSDAISASGQCRDRKRILFPVRVLTTALMICVVWYVLNRTLTPKYLYRSSNSTMTSTYNGFYEMEENTIDVLLLGSSQMASGISPQDLYDIAGIRSYNLSSNVQPMWITYYWILEALQYQSPKVIVIDSLGLFSGTDDEAILRGSLDDMREGKVKSKAIETAVSLYGDRLDSLSLHLANVRYHTRWKELDMEDFTWMQKDSGINMKGMYKMWGVCGDTSFEPLDAADAGAIESASFNGTYLEYMEKIAALCEEEGIELVLIKTPTTFQTLEWNAAVQNYADENGLAFYDFNTLALYEEIDFDFASDMYDSYEEGNAHANPSGARKMSAYLAHQLIGVNGLEAVADTQWEDSRIYYEYSWQDFSLCTETDPLNWLEMLDQDRYTIFISAKGDVVSGLNSAISDAIQQLGFTFDLMDRFDCSYAAIRNEGEITEQISEETAGIAGAMEDGAIPFVVTSGGTADADVSSILINGEEYSVNGDGLNIVVYDNELQAWVDYVCLIAGSDGWAIIR